MNRAVPLLVLSPLLSILSCGEDELLSSPRECRGEEVRCLDADTLARCLEGYWSTSSCGDFCQEGRAGGCLRRPGAVDECACLEPCEGTVPLGCISNEAILLCEDGLPLSVTCRDYCAGRGEELVPVGCYFDPLLPEPGEGCHCAREGEECEESPWQHCLNDRLVGCRDGVWTLSWCGDTCKLGETPRCYYDERTNGGQCRCE